MEQNQFHWGVFDVMREFFIYGIGSRHYIEQLSQRQIVKTFEEFTFTVDNWRNDIFPFLPLYLPYLYTIQIKLKITII